MQVNKKILQFGLNICVFYTPICFQSVIFNTIEQFSTECRKTSGIALIFLLNSSVIGRENSRHSLNQSDPKLQTIVSESLVLIGYLQCLKAFWLDAVISLGWFFDTQLKTALNVQSLCFKRLLFINKLLHTITPLLCLFLKAGKHNNSDWYNRLTLHVELIFSPEIHTFISLNMQEFLILTPAAIFTSDGAVRCHWSVFSRRC